jgi:hypothetical protein
MSLPDASINDASTRALLRMAAADALGVVVGWVTLLQLIDSSGSWPATSSPARRNLYRSLSGTNQTGTIIAFAVNAIAQGAAPASVLDAANSRLAQRIALALSSPSFSAAFVTSLQGADPDKFGTAAVVLEPAVTIVTNGAPTALPSADPNMLDYGIFGGAFYADDAAGGSPQPSTSLLSSSPFMYGIGVGAAGLLILVAAGGCISVRGRIAGPSRAVLSLTRKSVPDKPAGSENEFVVQSPLAANRRSSMRATMRAVLATPEPRLLARSASSNVVGRKGRFVDSTLSVRTVLAATPAPGPFARTATQSNESGHANVRTLLARAGSNAASIGHTTAQANGSARSGPIGRNRFHDRTDTVLIINPMRFSADPMRSPE